MPTAEQIIGLVNKFPVNESFIKDVVALYFCTLDESTPDWKKVAIGTVLGSMIGSPLLTSTAVIGAKYTTGESLNEKHYRQATEYLGW